jgi:TatD DNase family protein
MNVFTDSHCHVNMLGDGADASLDAARAEGVRGFLFPATKLEDIYSVVDLARHHTDAWAAVGFHPHEAKDFGQEAERAILSLVDDPRVVAMGEVGLDYHYMHSPRETQKRVLIRHLAMAREAGLPVIIHNRESTEDLIEILEGPDGSGVRGILHSYTESFEVARRLVDRGYLISFSGILTFKSAEPLREVARRLPMESVLIETDTPYLAPVPHRGKENQPAFVIETARVLADLWEIPIDEVAASTTANFERTFGVKIPS